MSLKSWGIELWDQVEKVFVFTGQGMEQLELFYKIVFDIHKIYLSLSKKYKNLSAVPPNKTKLALESSSYVTSLGKIFQTFIEQAGVYETEAEELRTSIIGPLKTFLDHSKVIINEQKNEFSKFKQKIEKIKSSLDIAWAKYFGAYVIKKKAEAAYHKVKDDKAIPRLEIEKFQSIASQKENDLEKAKSDYAQCLQQFNKDRSLLYLKDLPKICSELEMLDRQRAEVSIEAGLSLVKIQQSNLEKTGNCNVSFGEAIRLIDFKADSKSLVDTNKTSFLAPADVMFVDLMKCRGDQFNPNEFPGLLQQGGKIERGDSAKSLFAGPGLKGIELKNMLPQQATQRLDEINGIIVTLEKELAGVKTLYDTYRKDPNMGDKSKLEPQIDTNERKLLSLNEMRDTITKNFPTSNSAPSSGSVNMRPNVTQISTVDDSSDEDEDDFDTDFNSPSAVETKTAVVLYRFDATDSQQMSVDVDQEVTVVNYDDGSTGWTLVQHLDNVSLKGYVPTNYINLL